jgi:Rad52/22 family double-strand break repair protein
MNQSYHQNQLQQSKVGIDGENIAMPSCQLLCPIKTEKFATSSTPALLGEAMDSWSHKHAVNCIDKGHMNDMNALSAEATIVVAESYHNSDDTNDAEQIGTSNAKVVDYVHNMMDQSVVCDRNGRPVTVGRLLATKPLITDLQTRPGPGGKKLVYLSGDTVTRSLNEIFGYTGWNLQICKTEQVLCIDTKAPKTMTNQSNTKSNSTTATSTNAGQQSPMWHVAYLSHVRITLTRSGAYREDLGAGDSLDRNLGTAIQHAIKASITDAMKRAARHFGDKLGNSLYQGTFRLSNAPKTLHDALYQYDTLQDAIHRTKNGSLSGPILNTNVTLPVTNPTTKPIASEVNQNGNHLNTSTISANATISHPAYNHNLYETKGILPAPDIRVQKQQNTGKKLPDHIKKCTPMVEQISKPPMTAPEGLNQSMFMETECIYNDLVYVDDITSHSASSVVPKNNIPPRPRTSSGRRKSNPTIDDHTNTNKTISVASKKCKLNPYAT